MEIPQTRNRTFMVSLFGDYSYSFPKKMELKTKLTDYLEEEVDEKYFLSEAMVKYICSSNDKYTGRNCDSSQINKDIANTITTREGNTGAESSNYVSEVLQIILKQKEIEAFDFRYDEGIRTRVDSNCWTTITIVQKDFLDNHY